MGLGGAGARLTPCVRAQRAAGLGPGFGRGWGEAGVRLSWDWAGAGVAGLGRGWGAEGRGWAGAGRGWN